MTIKVVVVGYGEMFASLILGCIECGQKVAGVFRYERVGNNPFKLFLKDTFLQSDNCSFVRSLGLYEIKARSINSKEFAKEVVKLNADVVLVASWGEKIAKTTTKLPTLAFINCHPSLLPKYRGPNPYMHVIKNLEEETGVTFHLVDDNYDSGPVLLQKAVPILKDDTGKSLKIRCAAIARETVKELMELLETEIIIPLEQNEKNATYYPHITSKDILLDFNKTAEEICAHIRGFTPWQKCYFPHGANFVEVTQYLITENQTKYKTPGTVAAKNGSEISVVTGDGQLVNFKKPCLIGLLRPFSRLYTALFVKCGEKI